MSHGICRMWAVWIALLLWAAPTQGVTTNCVIPAVERLQNTSLTCTFSDDISRLKQDFKVQFYKSNTTDSTEVILDCFWVNEKPECTVHKCCEYDYHVTETLTLRVLNVTETRVGRYVCFVLPAAPDSYNFCNFTLTEKHHTDTSGGNLAALAVLVVIPVIICIIIIIIIWKRTRSQKAGGKTTGKKPCNLWPGQWCSAKEKPDDEESKLPLNKSKDETNDDSQSKNVRDLRDGGIEEDLHSADPEAAEKLAQKSDNIDRPQRSEHTSFIGRLGTLVVRLFQREPVNQNVELSCTPQQEPSQMKNDAPSTSVTGPETTPVEIKKGQTGVDKTSVSDVANDKALSKQVLPESGTNVSISGTIETVTQSQKMQSPSNQNDVITPISDQSSDAGTRTTRETSQTLGRHELQTINETTDQKTQKSDEYTHTTDRTKEGKKAKTVRKVAMKKGKGAQEKAEKQEKKAKDNAEKKIKSVREKAEKEEKLVKENSEKEEATAKAKAEELEKIIKAKAEREERMANDKAKQEEKIAKDKAEKEEEIAKRASKKMVYTAENIEAKVKKISNEKEEQMTKIAKRKERQMEIIANEKEEQLEKIANEKREELEKIANAKDKRLQGISKRRAEEIEKIKKKKEEEIEKIRKVKEERMETIINKKEKRFEEIKKKEEKQTKEKGRGENQSAVREPQYVQGSDKLSKEKESEDDVCGVEHANEADLLLTTKNSNDQVNPATRSQSKTDTTFQVNELTSPQDISEAPTRTQDQTLQAVDKEGNPVKKKNNDDIESNGKTTKKSSCEVS